MRPPRMPHNAAFIREVHQNSKTRNIDNNSVQELFSFRKVLLAKIYITLTMLAIEYRFVTHSVQQQMLLVVTTVLA